MRKYSPFLVTVVLLSAILIIGSQGRAGAEPLALGHAEEQTTSPVIEATGTCVPSLTVACVQGNRFAVTVQISLSEYAYVAASSSESAVFSFPGSSSDWQVVAKVLNGCSSNNHWWVFAAGATSTPYSLLVKDTVANIDYGFSEVCPLEDVNAIPCP
jgi:hypothetical protein